MTDLALRSQPHTYNKCTTEDVIHWRYLGRGNAVDKADLLETFLAHGEADLPALVDDLVDDVEGTAKLVHLVLHVHVHVATETCKLEYKSGPDHETDLLYRFYAMISKTVLKNIS